MGLGVAGGRRILLERGSAGDHLVSEGSAIEVTLLPIRYVVDVLLGHLVAIWVAHATAFEVFPGRLQAIRSQYPVVLVMVGYTMLSLWIVSQPSVQPPYL